MSEQSGNYFRGRFGQKRKLVISPVLQKELDELNLHGCWLSLKTLKESQGVDPNGFVPYRPKCLKEIQKGFTTLNTIDPFTQRQLDGYVVIGDAILAVMDKREYKAFRDAKREDARDQSMAAQRFALRNKREYRQAGGDYEAEGELNQEKLPAGKQEVKGKFKV